MKESRFRIDWWLAAAVALCLIGRLVFLLAATPDYAGLPRDVDRYGAMARTLAESGKLALNAESPPTASRPSLYPLFLSPFYVAGLGEGAAPLVAQAVLDAITALLLFFLTWELGGGRLAARVAALAWALYVPAWAMTTRLWSEPLSGVLLVGAALALARAGNLSEGVNGGSTRIRAWRFGWAGLLLGLAALARPSLLIPAAGLVFCAFGFRGARPARRLLFAAATLAGIMLALAPWVVRNALVFHAFVPATTHGGHTAYGGNCMLGEGSLNVIVEGPEVIARFEAALSARGVSLEGAGEVERDRLYREEFRGLAAAHAWDFARLSARRLCRLWFNLGFPSPPSRASWGVFAINLALLALLAWGLVRQRGRMRFGVWIVLYIMVCVTLIHAQTVAFVRYVFPLIPLLLGVIGVLWLGREGKEKGGS